MASNDCLFFRLPQELRNAVYDCASARPAGPYLILKEYFEKIDHSIPRLPPHMAPPAADTTAPDDEDNDSEDGDGDGNDDTDAQDAAEENEDGGSEDTSMIHANDLPSTAQLQIPTAQIVTDAGSSPTNAQEGAQVSVEDQNGAGGHSTVVEDTEDAGEEIEMQYDTSEAGDGDGDAEIDNANEDEEEQQEEQEDQDGAEEDEDEDEDEEDAEEAVTAPSAPTQTVRSSGRNTKYCHTLPILQLSHCPPPKELLQLCKQIHAEAVQQHRDKCVLTINVNKGFQHMSFFSETMRTLIDAPHSPLEHIRKLRLVIVWDSEWLREKTTPPNREIEEPWFLNFYFGERMQVINDIVESCPQLQKVFIEYHDSEDTSASRTTMADKLNDLRETLDQKVYTNANDFPMPIAVEHQENFSAPGTAHARDSLLALHRAEFDRLLLSGFNMH